MPVRVAILGCGEWGRNHVRVFSELRGSRVVLAVDPDPACRKLVSERFRGIRTGDDPQAALRDPRVDAVVIATPTVGHAALVKAALAAGKHVLCEKPLCTLGREARDLARRAGRARRVLLVGHVFLYHDGVRRLRDLIRGGEFGRLYTLQSTRTNLGPIRRDVNVVYDLATHDVSIFQELVGAAPVEVSARGQRFLPHDLEDVAFITLQYPDRTLGHIHASWLAPRKVRELTVVGERGMAVWDDLQPIEPLRIYDKSVTSTRRYENYGDFQHVLRDGDIRVPRLAVREPLKMQGLHFLECITQGSEPRTGGANAVDVVRVLEAVQRSLARGGASVPVDA